MQRRDVLKLLLAVMAGSIMPSCTSARILQLGITTWLGSELLWLYLQQPDNKLRQQVRLHELRSSTEILQALREDQLDAVVLTLDEVLRARASGIPLSVITVLDISAGADVVLVRPPAPTTIDELKGARVGVEQGALGALMLDRFLTNTQLKAYDITQVMLSPAEHERAWQQNEIDVLICFSPVSDRLVQQGAIRLFDSSQMPELILDVLAVRHDRIEQYADTLQQLVDVHFQQLVLMQKNPLSYAQQLEQHLGMTAADIVAAFKLLKLPDRQLNQQLLAGTQGELLKNVQHIVQVMRQAGILSSEDKLENLLIDRFVKA